MILTSNRLKLNNKDIKIYIINNFIFYRIVQKNKVNKFYNEIYKTIIKDKNKLREVIFNKCFIKDKVLYYKNRL